MTIVIYNDIFDWDGWGGELKLTSGRCHLRIYDLQPDKKQTPVVLRSVLVVVSDLPESYGKPGAMSIRSCAGHIATQVVQRFNIRPDRMLYVEYHPIKAYGPDQSKTIPERFEAVRFKWVDNKAFAVKWRTLEASLRDTVKALIRGE